MWSQTEAEEDNQQTTLPLYLVELFIFIHTKHLESLLAPSTSVSRKLAAAETTLT